MYIEMLHSLRMTVANITGVSHIQKPVHWYYKNVKLQATYVYVEISNIRFDIA